MTGTDVATYARERMAVSAFALEDGIVYHTYSTHSRGVDAIWGVYQWLDRAPKGRNETGYWWRRPRRVRRELIDFAGRSGDLRRTSYERASQRALFGVSAAQARR
jgi:hypothetical protein